MKARYLGLGGGGVSIWQSTRKIIERRPSWQRVWREDSFTGLLRTERGRGVQTGFKTERWRQIRTVPPAMRLEAHGSHYLITADLHRLWMIINGTITTDWARLRLLCTPLREKKNHYWKKKSSCWKSIVEYVIFVSFSRGRALSWTPSQGL